MTEDQKFALNMMYQALLEYMIWRDDKVIGAAAQAIICAETAFPELKRKEIG